MARSFFGFGRFQTALDGSADEVTSLQSREKARQPLPDIHAPENEAQLGEWLKSRSPTSHQAVGVEPGEKVRFIDDSGERRDAVVLGEDHHAHNSKTDVYIAANDPHSSGTYKLTFEPDGPRGLIETRAKKVLE